jgi:hypothetical protein
MGGGEGAGGHRSRRAGEWFFLLKERLIYVNNRFEGNALQTIAAMVEQGEQGR